MSQNRTVKLIGGSHDGRIVPNRDRSIIYLMRIIPVERMSEHVDSLIISGETMWREPEDVYVVEELRRIGDRGKNITELIGRYKHTLFYNPQPDGNQQRILGGIGSEYEQK